MQHWKPWKHVEQKAAVLELRLIGRIPFESTAIKRF